MRLHSTIAIVSLVLCACGDKSSSGSSATADTKPTTTATTAATSSKPAEPPPPKDPMADWKETDIEGVFSVKLPGSPKKDATEMPNPKGGKLKNTTYTTSGPGGMPQINISVVEMPKGQPIDAKGAFNGGRDNAIKATNAKLVNEKDVKLGKYDGHEFTLSSPAAGINVITRNRLYIMGQNIVTIVAAAPEGKVDDKMLDAFYDSLKAK